MLENWQNWCRLCAKIDSTHAGEVYKMESIKDQLETVNKYFMISIVPLEGIQSIICEECGSFLTKLTNFGDHCLKADQMFRELVLKENLTEEDLHNIRLVHGVDVEIKYSSVLSECKNDTDSKEELIHSDQYTDPLDQGTDDDDEVTLKEDVNTTNVIEDFKKRRITKRKSQLTKKISVEKEATLTPRRRGRPKRSTQASNPLPTNIKEESECNVSDSDAGDADEVPDEKQQEDSDYDPNTSNEPTDDKPPKKRRRTFKSTKNDNECEICFKKFCRRSVLKEHILEQHRQDEMPHVCSKCPKRFSNKYKLRVHETTHLPEEERRTHACPYCDKKFGIKFILQSHISAMHIGDKPFICEECGNSFRTKGALNQHQTIHTDERPCQCSFCPKKFKKKQHLKRHEDSHKDHMFDCPHCDLKLKNSRTLKMHLLVHSDHKQYKCNYCGNEYKRAKTLKDHLILHTGQRPYECPFCDKTFANGSNCRSHKKKAHPVELAALEASGEQTMVTLTPKLRVLQPKHEVSSSSPKMDSQCENGN